MKTVLIIGIGRFGKHLATRMTELGNEVMIVDKEEEKINDLLPCVTRAHIGDCMDEKLLRSLGVSNFDICFVCIGDNFQASLEITSLLKEFGAKYVVSKADRTIHEKFLLRNGANEVIHPERDVALKAARKYSARNVLDYFELAEDFSIFEIEVPDNWVDKSIKQVNVRSRYNINIIAIKKNGKIIPVTSAEHVFMKNQHLIIAGNTKDCSRILDMK
ncbi:trk system potassium uptake protein TrkA [Desulfitobacterium sp. LBE]|uniref:TrkA-N domain protein n=1 Tax=Desulfitobacterium hafniense (strain DSM 10664 / DCB-2) TaxID=272564 RepID=B8FPB0_DESHD|nr:MULTISPECIES: TrkA family potassium uptake protein [Desulfitobacterium]ACL19635.1 TrkA-N domain protein [Desulfitobacterium hafniense DCB-2]TWH57512.1 trk system potassium uptake protein TrkA [Desulfitobacterium sp. LBE]